MARIRSVGIASGLLVIHSLPASRTTHNPKRCVVMLGPRSGSALPNAGSGCLLLTGAAFYNNPNGGGSMSPPSRPITGAACALEHII
jgi:hypothetical protein